MDIIDELIKGIDITDEELAIDKLVYALYDLTEDEIKLIEQA